MKIIHKNPATHGIVALAARAFHFDHGVAEAEHLNGAERAAILARGHKLEEAPEGESEAFIPGPKSRKPKPPPVDISDPTVQVTEKAPPEIG